MSEVQAQNTELRNTTEEAAAEPISVDPDEVRLLAYQYWEERGHPEDSPEQDWIRAEHEIASRGRNLLSLSADV